MQLDKAKIKQSFAVRSRSGFATPIETFEDFGNVQNVSNGVANPVTLNVIDRAGHVPFLSHSRETLAIISRFMDQRCS